MSDWRHMQLGPQARLWEHDGLALTIPEWADRIGVSKAALYARLKKGASIEEALAPGDQRGHDFKLIEFNGEALTMAQWAERMGIPFYTIRNRLRRGWPVERALTQPSSKGIDTEQEKLCATPG